MNGQFIVKSQVKHTDYEYRNSNVVVTGSIRYDIVTSTVNEINGSVCEANQDTTGAYIGNFSGRPNNGEMEYSLSQMKRSNSVKTWDAIDEIEEAAEEQADPQAE